MSTRAGIARHRAENTSSIAVIAKAVTENASGVGRQAAVLAAASGLVLTSGVAANAAEIPTQRDASAPTALEVQTAVESNVAADAGAQVSFERPAVESQAAPAPVQTVSNTVRTASTNTAAAPAAAKPVASSGMGAAIAAAAYAQLGVHQDCTALVTNALAAVGIYYHGWPAGYLSLGRQVSAAEAQPGDLAYYQNGGMGMAHIAVYVGNGMAVHGGWNGSNTVLYSVNVGSGPVFIRVGG
ncbi:NlpC/P60 family protein [Sinomonas sp. JGH33]|uniref:NlpC/P60 family protein n=1 Tax=Sinomonas terricola TaxID=3110330 RepID=A0ABU5T3B7_9MICC|nr:NlpC/P60 family protein [Sinomonas sp. JGH33]MEA5454170.1 NlpC/P60 family protein [Sinomonas sp. JGH33]